MAGNWKLFARRSRSGYPRRHKWIMLTVWAVALALVLSAVTVVYDRYRGKAQLEEANLNATVYTGTVVTTEPVETQPTTEATKPFAPDFTVYDTEGNPVTLEDFRGKPVVVSFWASWSAESKEQMPVLQAAYDDYKDRVHFLIINIADGNRETRETAEKFLEERGYTFPVYYDVDATAQSNYELQSVPATYFVDPEGRAMGYAGAYMNRAVFEKGLAQCYHD